jgi:hypothetical protein
MDGKFLTEATTFILTGECLYYLIAFLNSKISQYQFSQIGTTTGVGTIRWKKYTMEQLRVPKISIQKQESYNLIVNQIIQDSQNKSNTELLSEIDKMIYNDLGLTKAEIDFINNKNLK